MGLFETIFGGGSKTNSTTQGGFDPLIQGDMLNIVKAFAGEAPAAIEQLSNTIAGKYLSGSPELDALLERLGLRTSRTFRDTVMPQIGQRAAQQGAFISSGSDRLYRDANQGLADALLDAFANIQYQNFATERARQFGAATGLLDQTQQAAAPFIRSQTNSTTQQRPSVMNAIGQVGDFAGDLAAGVGNVYSAFQDPKAYLQKLAGGQG